MASISASSKKRGCEVTKRNRSRPGISATAVRSSANRRLTARTAVGVDGLAEQLDLAGTGRHQGSNLGEDVVGRAAHLRSSGVRHDAEGAVLAATLDHRDHARGRSGAAPPAPDGDRTVRQSRSARGADPHWRQPARRRGARSARDRARSRPHRTGRGAPRPSCSPTQPHTPTTGGVGQPTELADPVDDLLRRLLPHRAGVEEDQIRVLRGVARAEPETEQLALQTLAVVNVHLAAPGLDEVAPHVGLVRVVVVREAQTVSDSRSRLGPATGRRFVT